MNEYDLSNIAFNFDTLGGSEFSFIAFLFHGVPHFYKGLKIRDKSFQRNATWIVKSGQLPQKFASGQIQEECAILMNIYHFMREWSNFLSNVARLEYALRLSKFQILNGR